MNELSFILVGMAFSMASRTAALPGARLHVLQLPLKNL